MNEMTGLPAELLKKLEYDPGNMENHHLALDYIKGCGGEFRSSSDINAEPEGVEEKKANDYSYKIVFGKIMCTPASIEWNETTYEQRNEVLKKVAYEINGSSKLIAELEHLIREIPQREVLKFDIPLLVNFFKCYRNFDSCYRKNAVLTKEPLIFTSKICLFSLGQAVCTTLSAGLSVTILATEDTAIVATLFKNLCFQAGVPSTALEVNFVRGAQLNAVSRQVRDTSAAKETINIVEKKLFNKGCTVVVTESGDLDSAVDMILSDATFTHVYPWRTNRLLIQESIFEEFSMRLKTKMAASHIKDTKINNKDMSFGKLRSNGGEVWEYYNDVGVKLVLSGNMNLMDGLPDNMPVATIQAFRSTKELLSLIDKEPCFALSLWCDSISISNEISLAANVSSVWINMYAVFDSSVPTRVRGVQDNIYGGYTVLGTTSLTGDEEVLQQNSRHDEGLKSCLKSLEKAVPAWRKNGLQLRLTTILDAIQKQQSVDAAVKRVAFAVENGVNSREKSSAVVHGNKLCITMAKPAGTSLVLDPHNDVEALIQPLISIVKGNSVIYTLQHSDSVKFNLVTLLRNAGVPIVPYKCEDITVLRSAQRIHAIKQFHVPKENGHCGLYIEKNIWSNVGETFAN